MKTNQWKVTVCYSTELLGNQVQTFQAPSLHNLRLQVLQNLFDVNAISMGCDAIKMEKKEEKWQSLNKGYWFPLEQQTIEEVVPLFVMRMPFEKGDDYEDRAMIDGVFQLGTIHTVKYENDLKRVNSFLKRGWYVLTTPTESGSNFTLGHTEEDAI